ncbi:hypothetical protein [Angustibacter luteus]|uniref:Uncharacterized protein n=1 Tax=Angustibacter luteus TaxID=658456 RepID=A0ABW1JIF3_9ACTN
MYPPGPPAPPLRRGLDVLVSTPESRWRRSRSLTMAMQCTALADRHLQRARAAMAAGDPILAFNELRTTEQWTLRATEHYQASTS